ncbi:MAG: hypothetical protein C0591_12235 [Marinilabiliales bacterium]|nr:MAG: hypothetical protein C0591_12235 [Marinilabiliales bacterium]
MNSMPSKPSPLKFAIISLVFMVVFSACKKTDFINDNPGLKLQFSNDSVIFDTVFTTLGSTTHQLMVYNTSGSRISISSIRVVNGESSPYRINVDGESGYNFNNIEIEGGDSLYIFVKVTIDPNDMNNPFVVEDDIQFFTNSNEQSVKLVSWGQNANYIVADTYVAGFPKFKIVADSLETVHWTNEKPYVVYGYALINSYGELIIDEGAKVYFHENSGLWAYSDGLLKVYGTIENPVYFQGDRLEAFYSDLPGQWDRIWLMEAQPGQHHEIHNAIIQNGFIGLQVESFLRPAENLVKLHNVTIQNMQGIGLFSRVYNIEGTNTVIANCGAYCLAATGGGYYNFKQATFANYWSYSVRNTPAVYLNNYLLDTLEQPVPLPINFSIGNSIIYGNNTNEFQTEMVAGADSTYYLNYVNLKTELNTNNSDNFNMIQKNQDPLFFDYKINDYRLDSLSPARKIGDLQIASEVPFDIVGTQRATDPDLGAYQFVPGQGRRW